jgi:glutathione S-transferase
MQRIVGDRLRPEGGRDPIGVEEARKCLRAAYAMIEAQMIPMPWAGGEDFSLVDCAAAPALFYADKVEPIGDEHPGLSAYLELVKQRPSFARVLAEAEPYFSMFPG